MFGIKKLKEKITKLEESVAWLSSPPKRKRGEVVYLFEPDGPYHGRKVRVLECKSELSKMPFSGAPIRVNLCCVELDYGLRWIDEHRFLDKPIMKQKPKTK